VTASGSTGVDSRTASLLCYSVWWVTGLVFIIVERHDRPVRFHAAQSLVFFGAVSLVLFALAALSVLALLMAPGVYPVVQSISTLVWLGATVMWLVLMLKAWRGEMWRVPLAAGLAEWLV
jgi:uncharacterized membrane protein